MWYLQDMALLRRLWGQPQVEVMCKEYNRVLEYRGQGRVRDERIQEIKAGLQPSGSLCAEKLLSTVLSRLFLPLGPFCTWGFLSFLSLKSVKAQSWCSPTSVSTASLAHDSPFASPLGSLHFRCVKWYLKSKDKCALAGFAAEPKSWDHLVICWDLLRTHHCTNKITILVFIGIFSCLEPR